MFDYLRKIGYIKNSKKDSEAFNCGYSEPLLYVDDFTYQGVLTNKGDGMRSQWRVLTGLFIVLLSGTALSALDPLWMFADLDGLTYGEFRLCDTTRLDDINCLEQRYGDLPDTGDAYNGSSYINFDYQFSSDTFKVFDRFDTELIRYKDYRPGYAGFKTAWDLGMSGFALPRYDYLIFAHKGPLAAHKVTVTAWYNDGECGSPSFNETLGTFTASAEWKLIPLLYPKV